MDDLIRSQRADGGWAQLPGLESDAYATGQALYALRIGGGMSPTHETYRKGVANLLQTQLPDGTWLVHTRSYPVQPYFESGFPSRTGSVDFGRSDELGHPIVNAGPG